MSGRECGFCFSADVLPLHDWLYELVTEITRDRDYAYLAFCRAFSAITDFIFNAGAFESAFEYTVYGIKSDYDERFEVTLKRRQNFIGLNEVAIKCDMRNKYSGETVYQTAAAFETSLGTGIEAIISGASK